MPAGPPCIIEPIWEQFTALLPEREVAHPLGCHRSRIPDQVIFEKLVQVLVFGCAYRRIADGSCSATTLRDRRDEWIACGVIETMRQNSPRRLRPLHRPGIDRRVIDRRVRGRVHHQGPMRRREGE